MKLIIGPSVCSLDNRSLDNISVQNQLIKKTKSNAIEINMKTTNESKEDFIAQIKGYKHRSLHLNKHSPKELKELKAIISNLKNSKYKYNYILVHPDEIKNSAMWKQIRESSLPFALENTDKLSKSGYDIEELERLTDKYNLRLVLDLQHAYEHDPTMKYAERLFNTMKHKIAYLHVSGENEEYNHSLLKDSKNQIKITTFLKKILKEIDVPITIEGVFTTTEELRAEIKYIEQALSSGDNNYNIN